MGNSETCVGDPETLGTYLESLVKIGPVTAEILLYGQMSPGQMLHEKNVTVTIGIC